MNNQLKDKLFNFEVAPPPLLWDRVAEKLDKGIEPLWVERVREYESLPPSIWSRILSRLNAQHSGTVVPFYVRYRKPLKYSTTVAAIFIIAIVTTLLINKKAVSETAETAPDGSITNSSARKSTNAFVLPVSPAVSLEGPANQEIAKGGLPKKLRTQRLNLLHFIEPVGSFRLSLPSVAYHSAQTQEWKDQYTAYNTDGTVVRLSKKMFDLINCAPADVPCKEKLNAVRNRLSSSAITGNFGGLLDMLNSLSETP